MESYCRALEELRATEQIVINSAFLEILPADYNVLHTCCKGVPRKQDIELDIR